MTKPPRSSTKRIRPANKPPELAKKLRKPAGKAKKPASKAAAKVKVHVKAEDKAMKINPKTTTALITIARTTIDYDDQLAAHAGGYTIAPGTPPIVPPNGDTLLHLLFFLIYTAEGGQLLKDNGPGSAPTPELAKANLKTALLAQFPALTDANRPGLLDAVIDAHFAADWYVEALEAGNVVQQQAQQAVYSQKLLAILGDLHDDAMAHEFSMRW